MLYSKLEEKRKIKRQLAAIRRNDGWVLIKTEEALEAKCLAACHVARSEGGKCDAAMSSQLNYARAGRLVTVQLINSTYDLIRYRTDLGLNINMFFRNTYHIILAIRSDATWLQLISSVLMGLSGFIRNGF